MAHDREVAGMRCMHVLEHLSDYVDGEISDELRTQIEAHLRGCDWCERFGNEFGSVVKGLREQLGTNNDMDDGVADRLMTRLEAESS